MTDSIYRLPNLFGDTTSLLATSTTGREGHVALVAKDGSNNVALYRVDSGVWTVQALGGSGVTLVGDVTGPSGSNTVIALHGTAGIVAHHGSSILWDAINGDWGIGQANPTTNILTGNFLLELATPFSSATGANRNAPTGTFLIPSPASGGTDGRWAFDVSGAEVFAVEATDILISKSFLQFANSTSLAAILYVAKSGVGNTLSVLGQTSTDNVGGNIIVGSGTGGGGHLAGSLFLRNGGADALVFVASSPTAIAKFSTNTIEWANTVTTPVLGIEQPSSDVATVALTIQGQAPFGGGSPTHPQSGDIHYICQPDVGDPPNPGNHVWFVNGSEGMRFGRASLLLTQHDLEFTSSVPSTFGIKPVAFNGTPHGVRIEGGASSAISDHNGGTVVMAGGIGSGAGLTGIVSLLDRNGQGQVSVTDVVDTSHQCVVLCANVNQSNIPQAMTNFVYVGDATGTPGTNPIAGHVYMSKSGRPYWYTVDGNSLLYNGANVGSTFGSPPGVGSFFGWIRFDINGSACMLPAWLFA